MDASDLADIAEAVGEFMDQTCTISRGGVGIGSYDCLILPMGAAGGVTGMSPDPSDAEASGLATWAIYVPIAAEAAARAGSRITGSRGLDLAIVGSDAGRSIPGFITITAAEQSAATPPEMIVLWRWNEGTMRWVQLPAQEFQTTLRNVQEIGTPPYGFRRTEATITLLSQDLAADVEVGDTFTYEDGAGTIEFVTRTDRVEARGKVRW